MYFVPPLTGLPLDLGIGAQSQKKIEWWASFSHPVYLVLPQKGFPLELATDARGEKTRMMRLPVHQNCSKIDLAI